MCAFILKTLSQVSQIVSCHFIVFDSDAIVLYAFGLSYVYDEFNSCLALSYLYHSNCHACLLDWNSVQSYCTELIHSMTKCCLS